MVVAPIVLQCNNTNRNLYNNICILCRNLFKNIGIFDKETVLNHNPHKRIKMKLLAKFYWNFLLVWAIFMLVWGLAGLLEYVTGITPIVPLQNAAYPSGVQFVHWFLITLTGGTFWVGYVLRLQYIPIVMSALFSNLAVLCTIETFDFMSEQWHLGYYLGELCFYVLTSRFLLLSEPSKSHFNSIF